MSYINKYLRNFKPYSVASHKVWTVDAEDRNSILKLDWNEATLEPSPLVKERLFKLLNTDFLHLYPATYNAKLHELLSKYVELPMDNVQYFASSDSLHEYISKLYITVGDPALILWPSYDNFRLTAQVAGAHVMFFELSDDFTFDSEAFETKIERKQPSLVYICNPNNPTGLLLEKEYIRHLLETFDTTMFLIDEAYIEFEPDKSCKDLVLQYENILITRTMSKAFGLANVRFGYLIASSDNIKYISSIRNPKNITTFAQEAVIGALSDVEYMRRYVQRVNEARAYFIKEINDKYSDRFVAHTGHGNFVMIECCDKLTKCEIIDYLERNNVFVRNICQSEIVQDCVRVTIGTLDQMQYVAALFGKYYNM
ncbi:MAG: histidinol-phosphate aminotransferase family protein [Lachnospiraceae bacterium]|jgi:histidinol-phosphate aminotransferase|nr:histidinol-phosphate aminotransferase family protein [Lachnospiraceae bacterium]